MRSVQLEVRRGAPSSSLNIFGTVVEASSRPAALLLSRASSPSEGGTSLSLCGAPWNKSRVASQRGTCVALSQKVKALKTPSWDSTLMSPPSCWHRSLQVYRDNPIPSYSESALKKGVNNFS